MLTESKKAFIEFMMSADVLRFGSFVTKSGRNTPYFVNTGNYKTGEQIAKLGKFYASLIKETVGEDFSAGTAVRETLPILYGCGNVKVNDMFISVNRCEVGKVPGKTAIMEVNEEFGIKVHAIVTVEDIHEYLKQSEKYNNILPAMEDYMAKYCIL